MAAKNSKSPAREQLIAQNVDFITRIKKGASVQIQRVFTESYGIRDRIVQMGSGTDKTPYITVRLVEIRVGKTWHSYLTSVLEERDFTSLCGG